jgi:hypothetical protein
MLERFSSQSILVLIPRPTHNGGMKAARVHDHFLRAALLSQGTASLIHRSIGQ